MNDLKRDDSLTPLSLVFRAVNDERVVSMIRALQAAYSNGGARFATFDFSDKQLLQQLALDGRWQDAKVVEWFIRSDALGQALPEVQHESQAHADVIFEMINPFFMVGELASCMFFGGAYKGRPLVAKDAFDLALEFCDAVFVSRFDDVRVFRTYEAWSGWFGGMAWDKTWVIIDKAEWKISLLCITDID